MICTDLLFTNNFYNDVKPKEAYIPIPNEKVRRIEWVYSFSGGKPPGGKTYTRPNYRNL
jgi:hypothetical protein